MHLKDKLIILVSLVASLVTVSVAGGHWPISAIVTGTDSIRGI